MTLSPARAKCPATWTIHQEVFQNEPAFATMKRAAAFAAGKLLVRQSLIRFDAHQLVLRAAARAIERRCFGHWHRVGEGLTLSIYVTGGRSANVGKPELTSAAHELATKPMGPPPAANLRETTPIPDFKRGA
jgi:hypothetical protein